MTEAPRLSEREWRELCSVLEYLRASLVRADKRERIFTSYLERIDADPASCNPAVDVPSLRNQLALLDEHERPSPPVGTRATAPQALGPPLAPPPGGV